MTMYHDGTVSSPGTGSDIRSRSRPAQAAAGQPTNHMLAPQMSCLLQRGLSGDASCSGAVAPVIDRNLAGTAPGRSSVNSPLGFDFQHSLALQTHL